MTTDPFTPRGHVSPDLLARYLRGELDDAGQRQVEAHLEADPLLREAAEGLALPGALEAAGSLKPPARPRWPIRLLGAGIVLLVLALAMAVLRMPDDVGRAVLPALLPADTLQPDKGAVPLPVSEAVAMAGHAAGGGTLLADEDAVRPEPFKEPLDMAADRSPGAERMDPVAARLQERPIEAAPPRASGVRSSRRLVFRHGLKLVHPAELYGTRVEPPEVKGRRARHEGGASAQVDPLADDARRAPLPYLDHMDDMLAAFASRSWQRSLNDAQLVLEQYPDDVNAQFYAGLSAYELGQDVQAQRWLMAAERNVVTSFREEAAWYAALVVERKEGTAAARPLFERIAREGGFYAERAGQRR